jgi:hypothetical protein
MDLWNVFGNDTSGSSNPDHCLLLVPPDRPALMIVNQGGWIAWAEL